MRVCLCRLYTQGRKEIPVHRGFILADLSVTVAWIQFGPWCFDVLGSYTYQPSAEEIKDAIEKNAPKWNRLIAFYGG